MDPKFQREERLPLLEIEFYYYIIQRPVGDKAKARRVASRSVRGPVDRSSGKLRMRPASDPRTLAAAATVVVVVVFTGAEPIGPTLMHRNTGPRIFLGVLSIKKWPGHQVGQVAVHQGPSVRDVQGLKAAGRIRMPSPACTSHTSHARWLSQSLFYGALLDRSLAHTQKKLFCRSIKKKKKTACDTQGSLHQDAN